MRKILVSLLLIAVVASVAAVGISGAWMSDMTKNTITTTNADVKIGERTGFPLDFDNLTPSVWTDWKYLDLTNDSTIAMDVYIGLQSKGFAGEADLKGFLNVKIERQAACTGGWVNVYDKDVFDLFDSWQKLADNMPKDQKDCYRIKLHLSSDAGNNLSGGQTWAWVLIYGAQWNGPAPTDAPWDYVYVP